MKLEKGTKVKVFCLADKPEGTIIDINETECKVQIEKGVLTVSLEDVIDGTDMPRVVDFAHIEAEKDKAENKSKTGKFVDDIKENLDYFNGKNPLDALIKVVQLQIKENIELSSYPCVFSVEDGEKSGIGIASISIPFEHLFDAVIDLLKKQPTNECFVAFDLKNGESAIENVSIDKKYNRILCILKIAKDDVEIGVCGYNDVNDIKKENVEWENTLMTEMQDKFGKSNAIKERKPAPIHTDENIGTAYNLKIDVKDWKENSNGYFYEGTINVKKLDTKTKAFLKEHKLNINDHPSVIDFFKKHDMEIQFMDDVEGFCNLMIANKGIVISRKRSKTRAILEAVETISNT